MFGECWYRASYCMTLQVSLALQVSPTKSAELAYYQFHRCSCLPKSSLNPFCPLPVKMTLICNVRMKDLKTWCPINNIYYVLWKSQLELDSVIIVYIQQRLNIVH